MAEKGQYLNILLIGRMGHGKSTTGNKLIEGGAKTSGTTTIKRWTSYCPTLLKRCIESNEQGMKFAVGHGTLSCTTQCEILSSGNIRVLDVPCRFRGQWTARRDRRKGAQYAIHSLDNTNSRWVENENSSRAVFHSNQIALRKADGTMKEELRVFATLFRKRHFWVHDYDCNVWSRRRWTASTRVSSERDQRYTAYSKWYVQLDAKSEQCSSSSRPLPEFFLGINDSPEMVYNKVTQAAVAKADGLDLSIVECTCIKCAKRVEFTTMSCGKSEPLFVNANRWMCALPWVQVPSTPYS